MHSFMKSYSILRPVQTAGRFRLRQGGAPLHTPPSRCRGRATRRRRAAARALPRALRLPREFASHSLLSDQAVILLNTLHNGDSPVGSAPPAP